jgi:type VI secretion system secreted protein VgrG
MSTQNPTQANRPVRVASPLGEDALVFHSMTGEEELGRPFRLELEVLSTDEAVDIDRVLGQPMTVALDLAGEGQRHFNGFVTSFRQQGRLGGHALYRATLRPWLWFLSRRANCRIFQEKTAVDIIKQVFRDHGFSDIRDALEGEYRTREFCVQYRETDFDFVSRLMEQEGIYYFFEHEDGRHTLVLADGIGAHEAAEGCETLPYRPPSAAGVDTDLERVLSWTIQREIQPGAYAHNDYDFAHPRADLYKAAPGEPRRHERAEYEVFDYPGDYFEGPDGEHYARVRMQELDALFEELVGDVNARALACGNLFTLEECPREDQNREYLVVKTSYSLSVGGYESGDVSVAPVYQCRVGAIESRQTFRPRRTTRKPVVRGPQTAVVVGREDEEIWTDEYGRIKVRFFWDREALEERPPEESSCWIRVAQVWAGQNWGGIWIPRVGHEVIVDFLEGDPDRPIVTGRVYNADNMPPYDLPDNATQSGVKSRSTKNGAPDNFNELRFEDKKGEEEVFVHAERDLTISVKRDSNTSYGNNGSIATEVDFTEDVGSNKTVTIGADLSESVQGSHTLSVDGTSSRSVTGDDTISASANQSISVGADQSVTVSGGQTVAVTGSQSISTSADQSMSISGSQTVDASGAINLGSGTTIALSGGSEVSASAPTVRVSADGTVEISGAGSVSISGGSVSIEGGTVSISGGTISLNGIVQHN